MPTAPCMMAEISTQLMRLNTSPTPTPFHTRAPSPVHQQFTPHTPRQAHAAMNDIHEILRRRESEKVAVSVTDGSALVPATTKMCYLAIYFFFNLGLTLFNKAIMIKVCGVAFQSYMFSQTPKVLGNILQ